MITHADLKTMGYFDENLNIADAQDQLATYSRWVESMIITPPDKRLYENLFGLMSEAGEVAGKIQKSIRDNTNVPKADIVKELGDVVFYATAIANCYKSNLHEVVEVNMDKLNSRKKRNKIKGSGDNR
jgi:NTP pyrophosphatase (non-canonical NTP hydrolase)